MRFCNETLVASRITSRLFCCAVKARNVAAEGREDVEVNQWSVIVVTRNRRCH